MGNHIGGGEEAGEFDTLVDVIRQQNGWRTFIMWWFFKTKVLHFKIENTPIKDKWKEKVQKSAQIPFCGHAMKLFFEEFNLVFFTVDQSSW